MAYGPIRDELARITQSLKDRLLLEKALGVDSVAKTPPEITVLETEGLDKEERKRQLEALGKVASTCTKCRLSESRTRVVYGAGNPFADLMFIGEGPGYEEDQQGLPFVGKAGQLLTKIIAAIKLTREEVYISNMVKCRPPENRTPREDEVFTCTSNYLRYQIQYIQPKIICALGNVAAQGLLRTKEGISSIRGRFHDHDGIKLMATFHPAYLLRNPQDKPKCWQDMKKVRKALDEVQK